MIFRGFAVGPFGTNCFIVGSEKTKEGMVIDPGADAGAILRHIRDMGLKIRLIVITHAHIDHIEAVAEVKKATGAQLAIHREELGGANAKLGEMLGWVGGGPSHPLPPADRLLKEGDVVEIGELKFKVLETPGHSPGGISLVGEGVAFTGDTLFNYGIGRTDFPGSSHMRLMQSINEKLMALPDDTEVYPGHGPETTIGEERKRNPFLRGSA